MIDVIPTPNLSSSSGDGYGFLQQFLEKVHFPFCGSQFFIWDFIIYIFLIKEFYTDGNQQCTFDLQEHKVFIVSVICLSVIFFDFVENKLFC